MYACSVYVCMCVYMHMLLLLAPNSMYVWCMYVSVDVVFTVCSCNMHVYMRVCMYVCTYVCTYVWLYHCYLSLENVYVCVCMHELYVSIVKGFCCLNSYIQAWEHTYIHTQTCIHTYIHSDDIQACVNAYIHKYIYTYTRTWIHTCTKTNIVIAYIRKCMTVCLYVCITVCMYACKYMHIFTSIYF
jgi:hypothetical protein